MNRKVLITGATGDTGRVAVRESIKRGLDVRALVHGNAGQTYPLFGPVEMDHDRMAAKLTEALGRKIVFEDVSIDAYSKALEAAGLPPYVIHHFQGAMDAYQHGVMSGMNDNVERLTGQKPISVGDFARAHLDQLNPKVSKIR
jgi:NAD(P)H dehydrogenase (quinone)